MSRNSLPASPRRCPATAVLVIVVVLAAAMLAGCGKKGNPVPPAGVPDTYPTTYPKQ